MAMYVQQWWRVGYLQQQGGEFRVAAGDDPVVILRAPLKVAVDSSQVGPFECGNGRRTQAAAAQLPVGCIQNFA
jgi:hypothetical protein